ncbi:DUF6361 family protein [Paracoccus sp. DMF-8]|uniref:DUF6361 family protein n=1 Tax=Paracoccus sp. DMF-8 TaxID=3019445 RepID=UPI0023E4063F|nr:DUF6361 family protein [Paracoccus sp. DMF-8]MDF3608386.1 DUF6361 family protein [Paracoccus sp. DMF-8]
MSALGWVSFGRAEADAVQTLIGALSASEARDELGLGAIRDGFSDLLFPGTSTIQTRLRYFLFLPQLFRRLDLNKGDRQAALRRAEADFIARMQGQPQADTKLLIGAEAGVRLKRMPSAVYWTGLGVWGVRRPALARVGIGQTLDRMARGEDCWSDAPKIDEDDDRGFALTGEEAEWIADRCVALRPGGTLLGHLMPKARDLAAITELEAVPSTPDLPAAIRRQLNHALAFADTMHGASLLYNLMLSKHFSASDAEGDYRESLEVWHAAARSPLATTAEDLIAPLMEDRGLVGFTPNILTFRFINDWIAVMADPFSQEAQALIARREVQMKGVSRARLRFSPQDYVWSGNSGGQKMAFRWPLVRRYLDDMAAAA